MREIAIALMVLALAGCARPAERTAEKALNALLPEYLGPAQRYESRVRSDSLGAMMRGRMKTVAIRGRQVQLTDALSVAELTLDAEEVEVDVKARTLKGVGSARFTARIEEEALNHLVRTHRPRLADLRVALRGTRLHVTVRPEVLGYPTVPITVQGILAPRAGGTALDFEPDRARLAIVPLPGPLVDFVADRLNPVVDLSALAVPIRVERSDVAGGALVLTGNVPPDDLVRWSPMTKTPG